MTNISKVLGSLAAICLMAANVPAGRAADPAPPGSYGQCVACHAYKKGAPHTNGPNLYGVFGRKVGAAEGYAYSPQAKAADFAWTEDRLRALIKDPKGYKKVLYKAFHAWKPEAAKALESEVIPFLRAISPAAAAK